MNAFEADIVATGSELTYGQLVDTNSSWLADQMSRLVKLNWRELSNVFLSYFKKQRGV